MSHSSPLTLDHQQVRRIADRIAQRTLDLSDYFTVGDAMMALSNDPAVLTWGVDWRGTVARLVGCSKSTLSKAVRFRREYDAEELPFLLGLGVGWSRLMVSLAIGDKGERHELLGTAVEERWSDRDLQRALQGKFGVQGQGGRPRRKATSKGVIADLVEILSIAKAWLDFYGDVWPEDAYETELLELDQQQRDSLQELLELAGPRMSELAKKATELRKWGVGILAKAKGMLPADDE